MPSGSKALTAACSCSAHVHQYGCENIRSPAASSGWHGVQCSGSTNRNISRATANRLDIPRVHDHLHGRIGSNGQLQRVRTKLQPERRGDAVQDGARRPQALLGVEQQRLVDPTSVHLLFSHPFARLGERAAVLFHAPVGVEGTHVTERPSRVEVRQVRPG
eukprot:scaffold4010_cov98-Phaeocystis_antarctica.AAC.4